MKNADSVFKYIVLMLFTIYIGFCICYYLKTGQVVNMPDWIVGLFTMVYLYFFRRAPKKEANNGDETVAKG